MKLELGRVRETIFMKAIASWARAGGVHYGPSIFWMFGSKKNAESGHPKMMAGVLERKKKKEKGGMDMDRADGLWHMPAAGAPLLFDLTTVAAPQKLISHWLTGVWMREQRSHYHTTYIRTHVRIWKKKRESDGVTNGSGIPNARLIDLAPPQTWNSSVHQTTHSERHCVAYIIDTACWMVAQKRKKKNGLGFTAKPDRIHSFCGTTFLSVCQ